MASEVKWIKITTDIFDDEKILLIESMPDAYAIITCWFKLLCLAGKQNNSGVFMMGQIAYTDKMLATIFRMKESTVQFALQTFEQFGMIEIVDGVITIPNWNKHQTLDSFEKRKERDRMYSQERRAAQKALIAKSTDESTDESTDGRSDSRATVGALDKEGDLEGDPIDIMSGKPDSFSENCREIVEYLNRKTGKNFKYSTDATQTKIRARIREGFSKEDFFSVIDNRCAEWKTDEVMSVYLRPETLFGTKFESYLQAAKTSATGGGVWAREPQDDLDFVK